MFNKITEPITLLHQLSLNKKQFINDELQPSVHTVFTCKNCDKQQSLSFNPYQEGFPIKSLYESGYISVSDLIAKKLVSKSSSWASHYGEYLVNNLPTLYFISQCNNCNEQFLIVFGFGEQQPGKWVCEISGVWKFKLKH